MSTIVSDDLDRYWLRAYLRKYYFLPSLAFWRALEARTLGAVTLQRPSLDVGGADGSFTRPWLRERPPLDVNVDPIAVLSPAASRAYRHVIRGDAQVLPLKSGAFNSVLCNSVIEHIPDERKTIREIARVLRPGGTLLLTTPSVYFHDYLYGARQARERGDEGAARAYIAETDRRLAHLRYLSVEEWSEILSEAGLRTLSHDYYLPREATELWDRWDNWLITPTFGRERWRWLNSYKLHRVLPPRFWYRLFLRVFEPVYRRAIEEQAKPLARGASALIRAERV